MNSQLSHVLSKVTNTIQMVNWKSSANTAHIVSAPRDGVQFLRCLVFKKGFLGFELPRFRIIISAISIFRNFLLLITVSTVFFDAHTMSFLFRLVFDHLKGLITLRDICSISSELLLSITFSTFLTFNSSSSKSLTF